MSISLRASSPFGGVTGSHAKGDASARGGKEMESMQ